MSSPVSKENQFLTATIGRLFLVNALPMALVMAMSGLLNIVDAAFLGRFVGPTALAAVSFSFPAVMILIAFASLVGGGMSSLFARHLGANDRSAAGRIFASAHGLALCIALALVAAFLILGRYLLPGVAGEDREVADLAYTYLLILACGAPVQFLMSVHADAARNEGRAGFMAILSVVVTVANIGLNYVLIVEYDLGVAGSAWGTVIAQFLGLLLLLELRRQDRHLLPLSILVQFPWHGNWRSIIALGLPLSLSFIGMALISGAVIAALTFTSVPAYADSIAAYGIVTRIFGFAFMPLMALALATQTIVGTNTGAGLASRANAALVFALKLAFAYCLTLEVSLYVVSDRIGTGFVNDAGVVALVDTIMSPMLAFYLFSGPILVLALFYQAVGKAGQAAALMLVKPYFLAPVLIFAFTGLWGADALWFAFPAADMVIVILALRLFTLHFRLARPSPGSEPTGKGTMA